MSSDVPRWWKRTRPWVDREAVTITKHGRDSVVLISADAYERLKALDTRRAYRVEDAPEEFIRAIAVAEAPAWTSAFDHEVEPDEK